MRVVCAMSGGVDSSVAAALMIAEGHDVVGMTMSLYDAPLRSRQSRGGTCCSPAEIDLAKRVCDSLGIPHYTVDERERFQRAVIDDFAREYAAGRTPNPCARCNEHVKFGPLLARAAALGAEVLVTGHYARIEQGALLRGCDPAKDQSYFLFAMGRDTLARVRFPLGGWTKAAVRARAAELGLANHDAPDSQELCFVAGGDYAETVRRQLARLGEDVSRLDPGDIVDEQGTRLGRHGGIHRVTVGQRRGLGVAGVDPRYVLRVVPEAKQVVIGDRDALQRRALDVSDYRALAAPSAAGWRRVQVQIRHRSPAVPARVRVFGSRARVEFDTPVSGVSPGQAAVVYEGDRVLGGGWIADAPTEDTSTV
ncbi:MAG: tRNA 2-thiouridine(34) synthase MnmA [Myxococcales bacterium FL481]|nr:MAG: tRNA 2-thiouridine(34) synthase MnmA [Myxococcales bacterium FL481]